MKVLDTPRYKWAIDAVDSDATPAIRDQSIAPVTEERESKRRAEGDLGAIMSPEVETVDVDADSMDASSDEPSAGAVNMDHAAHSEDMRGTQTGLGSTAAETSEPLVSAMTLGKGHSTDGTRDSVVVAGASSTVNEDPNGKGEDAEVLGDSSPSAKPEADAPDGDPMEKGMAKADEDAPLPKVDCPGGVRPLALRPGWGRHPDEDVLHIIPQGHDVPGRKRCIFCQWPRHPQGTPLVHGQPKGKQSPDGYPWGATLYDFYTVHPNPGDCREVLHMTGSALLEEMKALGEMDTAVQEIGWTMSEGQPRDEGVADTGASIRYNEMSVRMAITSGLLGETTEEQVEKDVEVEEDVVDHAFIPPPLTIPLTSPFHPGHCPDSWPRTPFENFAWPTLLQERIPLYLLPQRLFVHDPFNLLSAKDRLFRNSNWSSQPDVVRTYRIRFTRSVESENAEARKKAEEVEEFKARTQIILRRRRTKEQIENCEPVIEVLFPPYQRRPTKVEEGHLYISPIARVGEGHHSIVYEGEWDLPRDLFVRPTLCSECFKEGVDKEIKRLKDTGKWEKMLSTAVCGQAGFTGHEQILDGVNVALKNEQDGETIEREIICTIPDDLAPSDALTLIDYRNVWNSCMKTPKNTVVVHFSRDDEPLDDADVTIFRISPFSYESQRDCPHDPNASSTPRTARFSVIAKLSLQGDHHLVREAINYQEFPEHFFRHHNGYTTISQLRTIVPVHAIVPQFYGYYTPQMRDHKSVGASYLSPILLLENCGWPIEPETLSAEDREECISMVLRFQRAGWLHESIAPRNFLVQKGKPTQVLRWLKPSERELSFRLIDFGRSKKEAGSAEREATQVMAMFGRKFDCEATAGFW